MLKSAQHGRQGEQVLEFKLAKFFGASLHTNLVVSLGHHASYSSCTSILSISWLSPSRDAKGWRLAVTC